MKTYQILIISILALTVGTIGVGFLLNNDSSIRALDGALYEAIHKGPHFKLLDYLILPFNYNFLPPELSPLRMPSYYYFMILFTMLYLIIYKRSQAQWALFCFVLGTVIALIVTAIHWHFIFRERPFLSLPSDVDAVGRAAWEKLSSFPSGHARETALYATLIAAFIPKLKWPMILFVLFIVYSRVYIGAHYPSDAIVGALIGFLTAKTTLLIARELQLRIDIYRKGGSHETKPVPSITDLHQN